MPVAKSKLAAAVRQVAAGLAEAGPPLSPPPLVGLQEISRMFDVKDATPYQWRSRGDLVAEDGLISGRPFWKLPTIYAWAETTDRDIFWDPWGIVAPAD